MCTVCGFCTNFLFRQIWSIGSKVMSDQSYVLKLCMSWPLCYESIRVVSLNSPIFQLPGVLNRSTQHIQRRFSRILTLKIWSDKQPKRSLTMISRSFLNSLLTSIKEHRKKVKDTGSQGSYVYASGVCQRKYPFFNASKTSVPRNENFDDNANCTVLLTICRMQGFRTKKAWPWQTPIRNKCAIQ